MPPSKSLFIDAVTILDDLAHYIGNNFLYNTSLTDVTSGLYPTIALTVLPIDVDAPTHTIRIEFDMLGGWKGVFCSTHALFLLYVEFTDVSQREKVYEKLIDAVDAYLTTDSKTE